MTPEKKEIMREKLTKFLSLSPEEKHNIDEDPKLDTLFQDIQEMSEIMKSSKNYEDFTCFSQRNEA